MHEWTSSADILSSWNASRMLWVFCCFTVNSKVLPTLITVHHITVKLVSSGWMSGPTFSSPSAEVAEMNRIHFELEYTEGISQRMRIPDTLKVGPENQTGSLHLQDDLLGSHTTIMQVPERIVVAGKNKKKREKTNWQLAFISKKLTVYIKLIANCACIYLCRL